jgi:ABC-type multidrug transport system ATPase subunit
MSYTYYVKFQKDGTTLRYYGVRYAANAEPSDLGDSYFTSSKTVKDLIEEHGLGCFDFQVRREFDDAESAVAWEQKVLKRLRVLQRKDWINQSIGTTHRAVEPRSPDHARKIGLAHKGKVVSEETRKKLSQNFKGKKHKPETLEKMSQQRKGRIHISHMDTEKTKFVTVDEVQSYLDQGWIKGRKFGLKKGPRHTKEQREKWSKERKGKPNPTQSLKKKGMVNAIDLQGNRHYVTKEEFDRRGDLFGIRNAKVAHLV